MKKIFIFYVLLLVSLLGGTTTDLKAQSTTLLKWNFNSNTVQCNGAVPNIGNNESSEPRFDKNRFFYCPQINNGCGAGLLGSKGHFNTANFLNSICLSNFFTTKSPGPVYVKWDHTSTVFYPEHPVNLNITYQIPKGKSGCLSNFSLQVLQKEYTGIVNFQKVGVAVKRNGVIILNTTQDILPVNVNKTAMVFPFSGEGFCYDGSSEVSFEIIFGLVKQIGPNEGMSSMTGFDNLCVNGTCKSSPTPVAAATPATCNPTTGVNANGSITVSNFGASNKADFNVGTTYTGGKTYATATAIPTNGIITNTLPSPTVPTIYTVRVFTAEEQTTDRQVTLNPVNCPTPPPTCTKPTATVSVVNATCTGSSVNNNATIKIKSIVAGTKVGYSLGTTYAGPNYDAASAMTGDSLIVSNLSNPSDSIANYVIRVYNSVDACFTDYPVSLLKTQCQCEKQTISIISSDQFNPNNSTDIVNYEICPSTNFIDLRLTKTVSPSTGTTCPVNTPFVWTITVSNAGTMTARNIQVADLMPNDLKVTANTVTKGDYAIASGWLLDSLEANQSATLTLTTIPLKAGTFENCAYINNAFPLNDPNSSPLNDQTANEDDDACASITVTGGLPPTIVKEFSPMGAKPNTPVRLTIKITNNATTPINLTAALVDNLPSTPAQMTVATTPNLVTGITGVVATVGGTSITIPSGTVLLPGLNTIQVDVIGTAEGQYCNIIAAGALKTTSCDNVVETEACIDLKNDYVLAPLISKSMLPAVIQTGTNATLTIVVENRNAETITLLQDFKDNLPAGLTIAGATSGTCSGISVFGGTTEVGLTSGSILAANSSCTIIVPVTAATAGRYCNLISANAMIGNVNKASGDVMTGNEDHPEACVQVNAAPCTAIDLTSITQNPVGNISPSGTATLTAVGTGLGASTVYTWTATGGTFSSQVLSPTYTAPATAGTYTITVSANNNLTGYGSCTATATITINVATPATPCTPITAATATATPISVATGSSATLDVTPTAAGTPSFSYAWSGTGGFTATTQNPSTGALATAGGYSYTVTVTNSDGTGTCTATATTSLTVSTTPNPCSPFSIISASVSPAGFATGNSANLSVSGGGITAGTTTFNWSGTSGFSATTQNPSTGALATAGGYSYTVTVTNSDGTGTCTATATTSLTVSTAVGPCTALSGLSATATPSSIATAASASLNVTGTGITAGTTTFNWVGTSGFTATTQNPSSGTLSTAGGYSYTVTVTNSDGTGTCTATATTSLTVSTAAVACTNTVTTICSSQTVTLTAEAGLTNIQWYKDGTAAANAIAGANSSSYTTGTAGIYYYKYQDGSGCEANLCCGVQIIVNVCSTPVFDLALRKTLASGQSAVVSNGSTVTFTISVINQGNVTATNVQITDYIPAGLTLNDANWTAAAGGKTTLVAPIASIAAGATVTRNISFTVTATGTITNYAEISAATGGTDVDSNPDADNTNDGTPQNDVVTGQRKTNPTDDEDDHDIETISSGCGTPRCVGIQILRIN